MFGNQKDLKEEKKMKCFKIASVLLFVACVQISFAKELQEKFKWKEVSFAWPSESAKEEAITSGQYKPENNLPLGMEIWKDKLFITVPRYRYLHEIYIKINDYLLFMLTKLRKN